MSDVGVVLRRGTSSDAPSLAALSAQRGYPVTVRQMASRLETGILQPEAIHLYVKAGYTRIAKYGRHAQNPLSACFQKTLG